MANQIRAKVGKATLSHQIHPRSRREMASLAVPACSCSTTWFSHRVPHVESGQVHDSTQNRSTCIGLQVRKSCLTTRLHFRRRKSGPGRPSSPPPPNIHSHQKVYQNLGTGPRERQTCHTTVAQTRTHACLGTPSPAFLPVCARPA